MAASQLRATHLQRRDELLIGHVRPQPHTAARLVRRAAAVVALPLIPILLNSKTGKSTTAQIQPFTQASHSPAYNPEELVTHTKQCYATCDIFRAHHYVLPAGRC